MKYSVSITEEKGGPIILTVYQGNDYLAALDKALDARSIEEWRGKWIKFSELGRDDKWAEIY